MSGEVWQNNFDGLKARVVFCFWFGGFRRMTTNRVLAVFNLLQRIGVSLCVISEDNLDEWVHPLFPLHPAFELLSDVHKSDYLRAYFMCHYGGGYTDIKSTRVGWGAAFSSLESSDCFATGYRELRPTCIALTQEPRTATARAAYQDLIGMCAYIMRRHSGLVSDYLSGVEEVLSQKYDQLLVGPPCSPYDSLDKLFEAGVSRYPLRWTEIGSEVFHPVLFKHKSGLLINDALCPDLTQAWR
jgi:hypothetical protein